MQGTKVTEDREIRHSFRRVTEDGPAQHALPRIVKYTGTLTAPEWQDVEQGRALSFPWYLVRSAQSQIDKFETLCHVKADVSTAPHTSKYTTMGKISYERNYDVILLVGLTELKAQVSWTDSIYVRAHIILRVSIHLTRFSYA